MTHEHAHPRRHVVGENRRRLAIVLILTTAFLLIEVAAGMLTGSLALLADAGHMLTDVAGLVLALAAMKLANRPPSPRRTYGYHRVEILAALTNGLALLAVAGYILWEAWERFVAPHPIAGIEVLVVATAGLLVNLLCAAMLRTGSRFSLNVRGAYNEVLADALSSVGVLAGAGVVLATGWYRVDALVAAAIAIFILPRTYALLRDALQVLVEGTPPEVDVVAVRAVMESVSGVKKVHDLHVWTLTSGVHALSAHAILRAGSPPAQVLTELRARITREFGIGHVTVQIEETCCGDHAHA